MNKLHTYFKIMKTMYSNLADAKAPRLMISGNLYGNGLIIVVINPLPHDIGIFVPLVAPFVQKICLI